MKQNILLEVKYKHPKLMLIRHFINGIRYKYPLCCILQFILEIAQGLSPGGKRRMDYNINQIHYVPCNKCLKGKEL